MPRLVNKPPSYSLHKASGQAKVKFKGKTIYLGKFGSPESHQRYASFIAQIPKPEEMAKFAEPAPGTTFLIGEIVLRYYQHAQQHYVRDGVQTGVSTTRSGALSIP